MCAGGILTLLRRRKKRSNGLYSHDDGDADDLKRLAKRPTPRWECGSSSAVVSLSKPVSHSLSSLSSEMSLSLSD